MPLDDTTFRQQPRDIGAERDPVLRVLIGARTLLGNGWCRGALARDARDRERPYTSDAAVAYCVGGAVYRAGLAEPRGTMGALLLLMQRAEPLTVVDCNDRLFRSADEAMTFLDRVIESRRAELRASLSARVER